VSQAHAIIFSLAVSVFTDHYTLFSPAKRGKLKRGLSSSVSKGLQIHCSLLGPLKIVLVSKHLLSESMGE